MPQSPETCPAATGIASQSPTASAALSPVLGGSRVLLLHSSNPRGTMPRRGQSRPRYPADSPQEASGTSRASRETPQSWRSFLRHPCPSPRGRAMPCIPPPGPTAKSFRKPRQEFRPEFPPPVPPSVLAGIFLRESPQFRVPPQHTPKPTTPPQTPPTYPPHPPAPHP